MTQLSLVREDGAKLSITIDNQAGQGYLSMYADDGLLRREVITFGPQQTDNAIRAWYAGTIDARFAPIN